jgi:hypothetical protein
MPATFCGQCRYEAFFCTAWARLGLPVTSASAPLLGAKRTSPASCTVLIYDGVDAPPDGIDVPEWRC